ncbi:MAG: serine/threonine protein phosphatase, partial [Deltaproteobacteria bacterium]
MVPAGKIFAIGDIHGCLDKLKTLLGLIQSDWDRDLIVFLGDYVDRGPDSRGVIELLL